MNTRNKFLNGRDSVAQKLWVGVVYAVANT